MHGMIAHHDLSDILILRVALHTLHIKIAAIEAISQVVHIIKQVALCAARLVVDFDLIYDSSTFNVELRVETSGYSTAVLDSICFLFELLILLKCGGKNSLSRATLLLAVKLASTEWSWVDLTSQIAFKVGCDAHVLVICYIKIVRHLITSHLLVFSSAVLRIEGLSKICLLSMAVISIFQCGFKLIVKFRFLTLLMIADDAHLELSSCWRLCFRPLTFQSQVLFLDAARVSSPLAWANVSRLGLLSSCQTLDACADSLVAFMRVNRSHVLTAFTGCRMLSMLQLLITNDHLASGCIHLATVRCLPQWMAIGRKSFCKLVL